MASSTTGYENDNVGAFIRKDPGSTLDYIIQWSDWLGADTIGSVSYAITSEAETSPTLTTSTAITGLAATSTSGTTSTIVLTAGTEGVVYTVTCTMTTSGGRIVKRSFRVKVEQVHL